MKILPARTRSLPQALALSRPLLARAEAEGIAWMAASVVSGPAVALGAAQRAGRVLDLEACARAGVSVWRRATAGTAVHVGQRGILWALALPRVSTLAGDATPRTLLNRNVRGFLEGIRKSGALAHYFGREWISVEKRPAALLGFEESAGGAVLIEVFAGVEDPCALPEELSTEEERALNRYLGKAPLALGAALRGAPEEIAREVMMAVAGRDSAPREEAQEIEAESVSPITSEDDPMPPGFTAGPARRVPIGLVETGIERGSGRVWLGGDVLVPSHVRASLAAGEALSREVPIDGASLDDLVAAVRAARDSMDPS